MRNRLRTTNLRLFSSIPHLIRQRKQAPSQRIDPNVQQTPRSKRRVLVPAILGQALDVDVQSKVAESAVDFAELPLFEEELL